jgi:hypothetical protein
VLTILHKKSPRFTLPYVKSVLEYK